MYAKLADFAQTWGLGLFVLMFLISLVYALWPGNREKFRDAANLPLTDKDPTDD